MSFTPEQIAALEAWNNARNALLMAGVKKLVDTEMAARKAAVALVFNGVEAGTHYAEAGEGYKLKYVRKIEYKIDPEQVNDVLDALKATGNEGAFIGDRLVKWKPELSVTEYKTLPIGGTYKKIIDRILTTKDGSPELTLIAPEA